MKAVNRRYLLTASLTSALLASSFAGAQAVGTGPGAVELISEVSTDGLPTSADYALLSGNGKAVVFKSYTSKPGAGIATPVQLRFRDLTGGVTKTLDVGYAEEQYSRSITPASISETGRYVTYDMRVTDVHDPADVGSQHVYRMDTASGEYAIVDQLINGYVPSAPGYGGAMSADGRYVAFISNSKKLVADDTNTEVDLFLRDMQTGTVTRISKKLDGSQLATAANFNPASLKVTDAGNRVLFTAYSDAIGVPGDRRETLFAWDRSTDQVTLVSARSNGSAYRVGGWDTSSDGRWLALNTNASLVPTDTDGTSDVYRINLANGNARNVTSGIAAEMGFTMPGRGGISASGSCLTFNEPARRRATVYYAATGDSRRIPTGIDGKQPSSYIGIWGMSRDCSTLSFSSPATNLVSTPITDDGYHVYVWRDN